MTRILGFVIAVLLGMIAGLALGWLVLPATPVSSTPDSLRFDYKADYVLMAAEAYSADKNLDQAGEQLAALGGSSPAATANQAVLWASQHGYADEDLRKMADLATGLRAWTPLHQAIKGAGWAPPGAGGQP